MENKERFKAGKQSVDGVRNQGSHYGSKGWCRITEHGLDGFHSRGHYITYPNNALLRGNLSSLPYNCIV